MPSPTCDEPRPGDGAPCTLEANHYGWHSYAGSSPWCPDPRSTGILVCCPTCSERFDVMRWDGGPMAGDRFFYERKRRWFYRLRAFFRLLFVWRKDPNAYPKD